MVINLTQLAGAAPGNAVGAGTLASVVTTAAKIWENIFSDSSFNHTLTLTYRWGVQATAGTLAAHSLVSEGGTPHRETAGTITFDNDGSSVYFLDDSLSDVTPLTSGNSEFTTFATSSADLGGGTMNTSRRFTGATGLAAGRSDLFSVALHEIGHALGLSAANNAFVAETSDTDIDVTAPLPYSGSTIPTNGPTNAHLSGSLTQALMFPSISTGLRRLPSEADILANAQLSQFFNPDMDLDFSAVPEPGSFVLTMTVVFGAGVRRYRRRSKPVPEGPAI